MTQSQYKNTNSSISLVAIKKQTNPKWKTEGKGRGPYARAKRLLLTEPGLAAGPPGIAATMRVRGSNCPVGVTVFWVRTLPSSGVCAAAVPGKQ